MNRIDLIGRTFGWLTVLRLSEKRDRSGALMWECRCACGNKTYVSSHRLLAGKKKSCGCGAGTPPPPPRKAYPPKTDCVCYQAGMKNGCVALRERLCVTRGQCKFYKGKDQA